MYTPEVKARIEHIRVTLPALVDPEARKALMREVVSLIREGRMAASVTSANARARKAKATVLDGNALLADLEGDWPKVNEDGSSK